MKNKFTKKHKHVLIIKGTQGMAKLSLAVVSRPIRHLISSAPCARMLSFFDGLLVKNYQHKAGSISCTRVLSRLHADNDSRHRASSTSCARVLSLLGAVLITALVPIMLLGVKDSAYAANASTINFQGRLLNSSGGLVPDGNYHIEFKLYNASAVDGGETLIQGSCTTNPGAVADEDCLWTETRSTGNLVSVSNGYFSVYLGSVTALPNIDWSQDLYLGMNIGGSGGSASWDGEMSPRFKLTAVPYAFKAANVASSSTNAASTNSDGVSITTGNALGATSNSGNITLDAGTATGTTGSINIANTNASALLLGRTGLTAAIQGGVSVAESAALNGDTTIGNASTDLLTINATIQGANALVFEGATADGFETTLAVQDPTADVTLRLPALAAGTYDLCTSSGNCLGNGDILQGGNSYTTAVTIGTNDTYDLNFETNGTTRVTIDDTTGDVNFTGNLVVAASKSLTLTGGNTASRPASPTEGMVYFDTTTDSLLTYANGKWQSDRGEYVVVAASDSSQAEKDSADYVADGTADQTEINNALTEAAGGKVILLAGTYVANATITIPNNTTLAGTGPGTVIELSDLDVDENIVENSDTTTGTGVVIRDLKLDGRDDLNTAGTQQGVKLDGATNSTIVSLVIDRLRTQGIYLTGTTSSSIKDNTITNINGDSGIWVDASSDDNTISGNYVSNNAYGISVGDSSNNIIINNTLSGNAAGIWINGTGGSHVVGSNTVNSSLIYGVYVGTSNSIINGNRISNSGGATTNEGIYLTGADNNQITGNLITDDSCTTTCYAINIFDYTSDNNYLADNTYSVTAGTDQSTINDTGTGTRYASQLTPAAVLQSGSSLIRANATTVITGTIDPAASTTVTGVGTKFTTELQVGDRITVTGETRTVTAIATDTSLTVDTAFSDNANDLSPDRLPAALVVQNSSGVNQLVVADNGNLTVTALTTLNGGLTVQTGDTFTFNGDAFTDFTGGGLVNTGGVLTVDTTSASGFFQNGGNSFGGTATLGTNDANSLVLETNNQSAITIASGGAVTLQNATNSTSALSVKDSSAVSVLNVDTTNHKVTLRASTDSATLGAELATGVACSGTGWSGTGPWTHSSGTTALSCSPPASVTSGAIYQVSFTVSGNTQLDAVTANIGGATGSSVSDGSVVQYITTTGTGGLSFTMSNGSFDGAINSISVKLMTPYVAPLSISNASGVNTLEVRADYGGDVNGGSIYIGRDSGQYDVGTGNDNTAVGSLSMSNQATGYWNVALGSYTLMNNTGGDNNSAIGYASLISNTTGSQNTAVGNGALYANGIGDNNTAVGLSALANSTSSNNTAVGYWAGLNQTSGANNIFLGYQAGSNITTGSNNIIIGYALDASAVGVDNELRIGGVLQGDTSTLAAQFNGALTVVGLLTGQAGATISGATTSINASSNFNTNINTGTSTGTVAIGNSASTTTVLGTTTINTTGTATTGIGNTGAALTLAGSSILLNTGTLSRTAAGTTNLDLVDGSNTTLALINSGAGVANLSVDGSITVATLGSADTNTYLCRNSSNQVATCSTTPLTNSLTDNITDALDIQQGTDNYININTTNSSENISFGNATTNPSYSFLGSGTLAVSGSQTIAGNLAVDTNVLYVDTSNNRVGINVTPSTANSVLEIGANGSGNSLVHFKPTAGSDTVLYLNSGVGDNLTVIADDTDESIEISANGGTGLFNYQGFNITGGDLLTNGSIRLTNAGALSNITGYTQASGTVSTTINDNTANVFDLQEGTNNYININTTNSSENISFGNATTNPSYSFLGSGTLSVGGNVNLSSNVLLKTIAGQLQLRNSSDSADAQLTVADIFSSGQYYNISGVFGPAYNTTNASITLAGGYSGSTADGARLQLYGSTHATYPSLANLTGSFQVSGLTTLNGGLTVEAGDTFTFNSDAFTDLTGTGLTISGNALTVDNTVLDNSFFIQNGNSFAANAVLGTNDSYSLILETVNTTALTIDTSQNVTLVGDLAVNGDDITSDSNLTVNATGYVRVGDSGTPGVANGDDDLYVEGDLEADGVLNVAGAATLSSTLSVATLGSADSNTFLCRNTSNQLATCSSSPLTNSLTDNIADALDIQEGTNNYININTTNSSENISFGNATTNPSYNLLGSGRLTVGSSLTNLGAKLAIVGTADEEQLLIRANGTQSTTNPLILAQTSAGAELFRITAPDEYTTYFGYRTGNSDAGGNQNTGIGSSVLWKNTIGYYNTGVGSNALSENIDGTNNVAIGQQALGLSSTGDQNTAVGNSALYNSTGNYNTAFGYNAGLTTTGAMNLFLGYKAGDALTTGNYNILIGNEVDAVSNTGDYQLNIGDSIYGDLANDRIAVGTSTTTAGRLTVNNSTSTDNIFVGQDNGTNVFTIADGGNIGIKTGSGTPTYDLSFGEGATRTIRVETRSGSATAGNALTVQAGSAAAAGTAAAGGVLTLQGGSANGASGGANGGNVVIAGGTGYGTGVKGLVVMDTTTYSAATVQSFTASANITQANIDTYGSILISGNAAGWVATMTDPTITTAGRVIYVTNSGSYDITLAANTVGVALSITLKPASTATMYWNGTDWTAAGASSSTDLQAAYNNTATSAGGAEIVLSSTGTGGLTVRNDATTPITGGLLEIQTSIGSNLFTVNNNATEYAANGGAESSTFTPWAAAPAGGTVTRYTTAGNNIATGAGSVYVDTSSTANTGAKNTLSASLTANLRYKVSFTARHTSTSTTFTTLETYFSNDGTTAHVECGSDATIYYNKWTRVDCTFTPTSVGASNAIIIRHSDAVEHDFYIDNFSVTVDASKNHAVDGDVDSALGTNWQAYDADGGAGTSTPTRDTTNIYNTSGAVAVATAGPAANLGVRNNMAVTPSVSTQYLVTFYAKIASGSFSDITVGFLPAGGNSTPVSAQLCTDYNTQTLSTSSWTKITCLFTTPSSGISDPDLVIYQPTSGARTFYVDALSITLNTNNSSNVQVGGGQKGGPTTLFTLDRSYGAPIADNNDAYLGSMYYDTSTGRIQCYEADGWGACGAAPDNYVNLNPEYAGAVLNGSGVGTMTADFCSNQSGVLQVNYASSTDPCYTSGDVKNYYKWTSPQATQQTYSIYVTYQLPATFNGFSSDDTVQLYGRVSDTTNAAVTYQMYAKTTAGSLTQCGSSETNVITTPTGSAGSANTWYSYGINGNEATGCSLTSSYANGQIIFKINLKANSNASAYVSTLSFTTTGR